MLPFYVFIYTAPRSVHSKPRSNSSAAPESTGSHPAVLSPSIAWSLSNAFLFMDFRTLCPERSVATPLQSTVCTLFPVQRRGRGSHSSPNFQTFQRVTFKRPLTPLECAVPRFRALSPLECADPKMPRCNPFRMRSYKKRWGGGGALYGFSLNLHILPSSVCAKSLVFRSYENCRDVPTFFPKRNPSQSLLGRFPPWIREAKRSCDTMKAL
jgi:hypothetical protein